MDEQKTIQCRTKSDAWPVAHPFARQNASARMEIRRPGGRTVSRPAREKLVRLALTDPIHRRAGQNELVGNAVGVVAVWRVRVGKPIAVSAVIATEVHKRGTAKAVGEFPVTPRPCPAMIGGPGKLRVARVPGPQIKDALHAEQPARFPALVPI